MSHHNHGKRILPHDFKYPLFLLGLFVIVAGGVGGIKMGIDTNDEVAITVVGFVMMFLGIILE